MGSLNGFHPTAFSHFYCMAIRLRGLICIVIPVFMRIRQTVAEISHLTFSKMAAVLNLAFLPHEAMPSTVYAVVMRLCVCLSVTLRYCIKMAKCMITQIMPHDSPVTLVF